MSLFSSVPTHLFSVLTGTLKHTHINLLLLTYEQHRKSISTIDREIIIDLFVEYLETAPEDITISDDDLISTDNRERAFYFLRKFIDTGWFIQEQDFDHIFRISLPDYSLRLLEAFKKIIDGYQMEFRGHVLAIYQNLTGEEATSYVAIHQAYELTLELIDGLKSLNHNIKRYTEKLLQTEKIHDMLKQIFDEYEINVLGAQYYRLRSSDHVSKYRTRIMDELRSWQYNFDLIRGQARLMVNEKQAGSQVEGENLLNEWLRVIEDSFEQIDDILQEIDRRNRQYASAAAQQIRLQLLQSESLEGRLNRMLGYLKEQVHERGEKAALPEALNQHILLHSQQFVDGKSIRLPAKSMKKHTPKKTRRTRLDPKVKQRQLNHFKSRVAEEITVEEMNDYVACMLQDKDEIHLSEMPLDTRDDWVRLIYSVVYSSSKKAKYSLQKTTDGIRIYHTEVGSIPNRSIKKKED